MAEKIIREKLTSLDHYRAEGWGDYRSYYDGLDPVVKEKDLRKFVCKMPLNNKQRRNLLTAMSAPVE